MNTIDALFEVARVLSLMWGWQSIGYLAVAACAVDDDLASGIEWNDFWFIWVFSGGMGPLSWVVFGLMLFQADAPLRPKYKPLPGSPFLERQQRRARLEQERHDRDFSKIDEGGVV